MLDLPFNTHISTVMHIVCLKCIYLTIHPTEEGYILAPVFNSLDVSFFELIGPAHDVLPIRMWWKWPAHFLK
jgi:hypothetical protein